jgi:hypothetical protein
MPGEELETASAPDAESERGAKKSDRRDQREWRR